VLVPFLRIRPPAGSADGRAPAAPPVIVEA